jgi:hypothetical protein
MIHLFGLFMFFGTTLGPILPELMTLPRRPAGNHFFVRRLYILLQFLDHNNHLVVTTFENSGKCEQALSDLRGYLGSLMPMTEDA